MVITIQVQNLKGLNKRIEQIKKLPVKMADTGFELAKMFRDGIKRQYLIQQKFASRTRSAGGMVARRETVNRSVVAIPLTTHNLDTMQPHYVALRPGRAIRSWADKHYGKMVKSGKSRVFRGRDNRILYQKGRKSAVFVTPDPFVDKGINKTMKRFQGLVKKRLQEAIGG